MVDKTPYLKVYADKSILFDGTVEYVYEEGAVSSATTHRLQTIKHSFQNDFLVTIIENCKKPDVLVSKEIKEEHLDLLKSLVRYTSEMGRAIVGLSILQLCIKCMEPTQSIRLHKASGNKGSFSWKEGLPMRVLDTNYVTPTLRKYGLLNVNKFGIMMTRSLAENYPYSKLYKAAIKGARMEWLEIVDLLESNELNPDVAIHHLITLLINKSDSFQELADSTLQDLGNYIYKNKLKICDVTLILKYFIDSSSYSARIFEVALHSLFQVFAELKLLPGHLKNLSQMRSANKKHGNIGDIEITGTMNATSIIEAWDAKYGKPYLRDELEELADKLEFHPETEVVGFVVNDIPNRKDEINNRIIEIKTDFEVEVFIFGFEEWVEYQIKKVSDYGADRDIIASKWLISFAETICQKRRELAPIDEPCDEWVLEFKELIKNKLGDSKKEV